MPQKSILAIVPIELPISRVFCKWVEMILKRHSSEELEIFTSGSN
jgi:hypothetical protein